MNEAAVYMDDSSVSHHDGTGYRTAMSSQSAATAYCDVAVVGGGVLGCFAARELAGLGLRTTLIEQELELCAGITKANTAIVYSGAYAKPGTLKAGLCVQASQSFGQLCDELGVRFERCGALMACFGPRGLAKLEQFLDFGRQNGTAGLRILSGNEARALEPGLSPDVFKALYDPNVGTVLPWELGLAAARDAATRGAKVWRGTQVCAIAHTDEHIPLAPHEDSTQGPNLADSHSGREDYYILSLAPTPRIPSSVRGALACPPTPVSLHARAVVNCAGLHAGKVLEMLTEPQVHIVPEKGCYYVLDTKAASNLQHVIFCEPEAKQKGLTLVPTIGGNILVGPTQEEADSSDDHATTLRGFDWLNAQTQQFMPTLPLKHLIRSFAATRPNPYWAQRDHQTGKLILSEKSISDFIIEEHDEYPGFISFIGIKTPGLTCAHELGVFAASKVAFYLQGAHDSREAPADTRTGQSASESSGIATGQDSNADAGTRQETSVSSSAVASAGSEDNRIVCRCRSITRGELIAALRSEPRPVTLDGIKRLTECGTGRCQGSFCTQRILEIMAEELKVPVTDLLKDLPGSQIVLQQQEPTASLPMPALSPSSLTDACTVAIIGGGAAGMTTALELVGQGVRDIAIIDREAQLGGVLNQCVHDGFGMEVFAENITGTEFAARLRAQIEQAGDAIRCYLDTTVLSIEMCQARLVLSDAKGTHVLLAHKVVLATGCRERSAASLPLAGSRPAGIVTAGTLQKMLNCAGWRLGTRAVILGSGDVGLIVARRLKLIGCEVACVVEISGNLGGRPFNKQRCLDANGIPLVLNSTITEVFGEERVSGVTVRNMQSGFEQHIDCDLLVSSLGLIPERELVEQWEADLPPWLIACGNADHVYDLVDTLVQDTRTKLQGFIKDNGWAR